MKYIFTMYSVFFLYILRIKNGGKQRSVFPPSERVIDGLWYDQQCELRPGAEEDWEALEQTAAEQRQFKEAVLKLMVDLGIKVSVVDTFNPVGDTFLS